MNAVRSDFIDGRNVTTMINSAVHELNTKYGSEPWWPTAQDLIWVISKILSKQSHEEYQMTWGDAINTVRNGFKEFLGIGSVSEIVNISLSYLRQMGDAVLWLSKFLYILGFVWNILLLLGSWGMWAFLFMYFLMQMLTSKSDTLAMIVRMALPGVNEQYQDLLTAKLRLTLQGVFFLPIQMSSINAAVTLGSGLIFGIDFVFFATIITFLMSMLQILGGATFLVCIPWSLALLAKSGWLYATAYFAIHVICFNVFDGALYGSFAARGEIQSPLFTALSIGLGFFTFGLQGILFGPLLVCILGMVMTDGSAGHSDDDDEEDARDYTTPFGPEDNNNVGNSGGVESSTPPKLKIVNRKKENSTKSSRRTSIS